MTRRDDKLERAVAAMSLSWLGGSLARLMGGRLCARPAGPRCPRCGMEAENAGRKGGRQTYGCRRCGIRWDYR
jgi:hypothetical protein